MKTDKNTKRSLEARDAKRCPDCHVDHLPSDYHTGDKSKTGPTEGPWEVSKEFQSNDGQVCISAPDPEMGRKRIALVDCHAKYKRGEGWKAKCEERDANARLLAGSWEMRRVLRDDLDVLFGLLDYFEPGHELEIIQARRKRIAEVLARIEGD